MLFCSYITQLIDCFSPRTIHFHHRPPQNSKKWHNRDKYNLVERLMTHCPGDRFHFFRVSLWPAQTIDWEQRVGTRKSLNRTCCLQFVFVYFLAIQNKLQYCRYKEEQEKGAERRSDKTS